jgi:hypothetical protein
MNCIRQLLFKKITDVETTRNFEVISHNLSWKVLLDVLHGNKILNFVSVIIKNSVWEEFMNHKSSYKDFYVCITNYVIVVSEHVHLMPSDDVSADRNM